jgi:hypothetical protein
MEHATHSRAFVLGALGLAVLLGTAAPAGAQDEEQATSTEQGSGEGEPTIAATATPEAATAAPTEAEEAEGAATDEPAEEAPPPPRGPALRFANSFFTWTNAVTANTFAPGAQLTYDPTYVMSFSLTPRFYLTDSTFLWLSQGLSIELTDTNDGTYNREPLLDDTLLDLRQLVRWEGFVFQGQVRLGFPLSKASQAAGRVMQTGFGLTVTRPFPELAAFTVSLTGGYRRWWATRNYAATAEPVYASCEQLAGAMPSFCTHAGAGTPARDIVVAGAVLSIMPAPGLTVAASGFYLGLYGEEIATTNVPINGGGITVVDDSPTHWRHFTYFSLAVAYDVLPWLNLQLGVQNSGVAAPLYNPDGSVRSPFNVDTQIFLSTTVGLDALYDQLVGTGDEELSPAERQRRRQGLAQRGGTTTF